MEVERTEYETTIGKTTVLRKQKVGNEWRNGSKLIQKHVSAVAATDFGLPYDASVSDEAGRHPSSETEICNPQTNVCSKVRETHVKYEWDYVKDCLVDYPCTQNRNRRVVAGRTTFTDDGGKTADVSYDDFDGLGHYRETKTDGTFASGNVRTSNINYNPTVRTYKVGTDGSRLPGFTMISADAPWILNTYNSTSEKEGDQTAHTRACFDTNTGFLKRTRRMASDTFAADDLVAVFTADAAGFVTRQEYFGGVKNAVPVTNLCTLSGTHNAYTTRIDHTYEYGSLKTSRYVSNATNMPFFSVNNVIDAGTGLVYQSKDTADEVTTFDYDTSARLTTVSPPDVLSTTYDYIPATANDNAKVAISTGTGSNRIATEIEYDRLGRVWREKSLMPSEVWSIRETLYDFLGRRSSVSEPGAGAPSTALTKFTNYDAFGRPGTVTLPDGSTTTYSYFGNRVTTRVQKVATSATGETSVAVTEEFDRAGRLIKVTENAGGSDAAETTYEYDVGNRLKLVTMSDATTTQSRTFDYDLRGWLSSEEHPESGVTSYEHDVRGKVVTRTTPVSVVTFAYDAAERLKTVKDGSAVIRDFTYDTATGSGNGKPATSVQHHRGTPLGTDITITESYVYDGHGGRLSEKKTVSSTGETFTDSYAYDDFGQVETVTYPACASCGAPSRTITNELSNGLVTEVVGYTSASAPITYHPNGIVSQVRHLNAGGAAGPLYQQTLGGGMARTGSITVSNYCDDFVIDAQPADASVPSGSPPNLKVTAASATSFQWFYAGSGTAVPNQNTDTLTQPVTQVTTFFVRVGNGICTIDSRVVTVTVCDPPNATITAPATLLASASATASVPAAGAGATCEWSMQGGEILSGSGTNAIMFRAGCSGPLVLRVTVNNVCQSSSQKSVTITPVSIVVDDPLPINPGGSASLTARITGTGQFRLEWSDGFTQNNVSSSVSRSVSPPGTTNYSVVARDRFNCTGSDTALVTVVPPAPFSLIATATATNAVQLSWQFSGNADDFRVYRNTALVAVTTATSHADSGVAAGQAYMYQVHAVKSGTPSDQNPRDLATTVMLDNIIPGTTIAAAAHIVQLQTAVNAVRRLAGQPIYSFDVVAPGVVIRASHIQQLRTALDQARSALILPAIIYTYPAAPGHLLRAADITDLQRGVK